MATILQSLEPPDGGVAEHVVGLSAGLAARGHRVIVAGPEDGPIRGRIGDAGIEFRPIPFVGSMIAPRHDLAAARALAGVLQEERPDVIHAHGAKAGAVLRPLGWTRRTPVLYTPHCFAFISNPHERRHAAWLRRRLVIRAERTLGTMTTRLICVSRYECREAAAHSVVRPNRRRVIYNGVAVTGGDPPDPELIAFKEGGILVGVVTALRTQKRLERLIEAGARLGRAGGVRFAVVGDGPERARLVELIRTRGAEESVRVFPFGGTPGPALAALDVFALPSEFESLPIAVIEAMAHGLPVVASAVGGIPEMVDDGGSGLLVPPGDVDRLGDAIRRLAEDRQERVAMGRRAREIVADRFGLGRMVTEIEREYLDAIAGRNEPSATTGWGDWA